MQLFYLINDWAGQSEALDGALRFFYVAVVPLLATALLALLFFSPRRVLQGRSTPLTRAHLLGASLLSLVLCCVTVIAINAFQKSVLGTPPSPRPFMTHWANILVVEPNDNSFPCFEVMLAAASATCIWAIAPRIGILAWGGVLLLGFARTFCGSNYPGDSLAGAILGVALSTLALALCRVRLPLPSWRASTQFTTWRLRHQAAFSVLTLFGLTLFAGFWLLNAPGHSAKFKTLLGLSESVATAAPSRVAQSAGSTNGANGATNASSASTVGARTAVVAPLPAFHEGEGGIANANATNGMMKSSPGEMLLASRAARLDGHLPAAEKHIETALRALRLPQRIIGVNVAQVVAGTTAWRSAAIRFEVKGQNPKAARGEERRRTAQTAAALVKRAFQADAQLQHVDVLGIKLSDSAGREYSGFEESKHKDHAHSSQVGARPVFTASIRRSDLILRQKDKPRWVNDPRLEGGLWLRVRSLLFIDSQVLPTSEPMESQTAESAPRESLEAGGQTEATIEKVPAPVVPKKIAPRKITPRKVAPRKIAPPRRAIPSHLAQPKPLKPTTKPEANKAKTSKVTPTKSRARKTRVRRYRSRRYRSRRYRARRYRGARWRIRRDRSGRRYKAYYR